MAWVNEVTQDLEKWSIYVPFDKTEGDVEIICCPEDRECSSCKIDSRTVCKDCTVPICASCSKVLHTSDVVAPPACALANDMWISYADTALYEQELTLIEMICCSVCVSHH